ncbi:MAG TPA: tetratricopeptide repeat protein [Chryseosolibacter sp.]
MKSRLTLCAMTLVFVSAICAAQSSVSVQKADSLFFLSDWKGAIAVYEAALKAGEAPAIAWNRLGFSYHNIGQYDKAIANYKKSLENKPAPFLEATVQSRLARIASIRKDADATFAYLDKAIALGYVNFTELETNPDFNNVRTDKRFSEVVKVVTNKAFPCMTIPQAREFDFWVGEWDVFQNGTNVQVGTSNVEIASGGCMILENWTALGPVPNTGKSINYVNSASGKWEQHWVGSGGLNLNNPSMFVNGVYKDGAMRFEFETLSAQNQKQIGRFIFYNQGPDQVRQFNEVSADNGKTWTTTYDFIYKRKKSKQ